MTGESGANPMRLLQDTHRRLGRPLVLSPPGRKNWSNTRPPLGGEQKKVVGNILMNVT